MANKKYDLVIVGAGYAGLMAAKTAGENGIKVALLEMKHNITRLRRSDGQTLIPGNEEYLGEWMVFNPKNHLVRFLNSGLSFRYEGPYRNIYAVHLYSFGGQDIKFGDAGEGKRKKLLPVSIATEKELILKSLLDQAVANGVEVFPGTRVTDVKKTADGVKIISDRNSFEGTFAIGADGTNSRVAQRLGFNKERKYYSTMNTVGYLMKGLKVPDPDTTFLVIGRFRDKPVLIGIVPRPAEDIHIVIFISLDVRLDFVAYHDFVIKESELSHWFKGCPEEIVSSSANNMWSTIVEPFKDNVLLVGDAIWTQESENTGALLSGGKAANAVTYALLQGKPNRDGISSYLDWWKKTFVEAHPRDMIMDDYVLGVILDNDQINYLFSLLNVVMPPSMLPYTLARYIGEAIGEVVPILQKEKPEILVALGRMQQETPDQILAKQVEAGVPNR